MPAQPPMRDPLAESHPKRDVKASDSTSAGPALQRLSLGAPRGRGGTSTSLSLGPPRNTGPARSTKQRDDDAVRATDSDALVSRLSAIRLGYLPPDPYSEDLSSAPPTPSYGAEPVGFARAPFVPQLCGAGVRSGTAFGLASAPPSSVGSSGSRFGYTGVPQGPRAVPNGQGQRRPPLINIGTYLRCRSIDELVESFLVGGAEDSKGKGKGKQIVSLGAGSDSRFWRIKANEELSQHLSHYLELDFAQLTRKKVSSIRRSQRLQSALSIPTSRDKDQGIKQTLAAADDSLSTPSYSLLPFDLRAFGSDAASDQLETIFGRLDPRLPTLLLFECVLAYIDQAEANQMIQWLGTRFERIAAFGYDMCIGGSEASGATQAQRMTVEDEASFGASRFGRVMLQNLEARGLSLPGAKAYPTLQGQAHRYVQLWAPTDAGSPSAEGKSLHQVWQELEKSERDRISRVEGLDEVEELDMLLEHYCITVATRGVTL